MNKTTIHTTLWGLVLALAVCGLAGCGAVEKAMGFRKPTAKIVGVRFRNISLTSATFVFDVQIGNPYSVPLPLANIDYALASEGSSFLSGKADLQGTIPAQSQKTVSLPLVLEYLGLLRVLRNVRPGSVVPYTAEMGLSVDAPVAGPLRLPLRKEGKLPVPAPPRVEIIEIRWDKLGLDEAGGRVRLQLTNQNKFAVTLSKLTYALSLGGVQVAKSSLARAVPFGADGGEGTIEIPIAFSPKNLGLAAFRMITGKGAGYDLDGTMDAKTDFGPMSLPIKGIGKTVFRRLKG